MIQIFPTYCFSLQIFPTIYLDEKIPTCESDYHYIFFPTDSLPLFRKEIPKNELIIATHFPLQIFPTNIKKKNPYK